MANFKARDEQLRVRLAELVSRQHRIESHLVQPSDPDWEERATDAEMDEVLEGLGHAGNAEIQAIYAALSRIKSGSYGVCARCENDISEQRLDVLPHTPLCRACARDVAQKT
jgi:RNA polymerase-binding transcription factor DksA